MDKNTKSFEEGIERLEEIIKYLEEGNVSLEEGVHLFEEGMELSKMCSKKLESVENKIKILIQEDGNTREEIFDMNREDKKDGI